VTSSHVAFALILAIVIMCMALMLVGCQVPLRN